MCVVERVRNALKSVYDPELNINVVDLGLIYNIEQVSEGIIDIAMTLTTPGCPLHDSIVGGVKHCVQQLEAVNQVNVNVVWEPEWSPDKMTEEARSLLR